MLTTLSVRHFAVVEEIEVDFGPGMSVVTGETGAGKSLLVDALMLLSGARADTGMIRPGADRAELHAEFDLASLSAARQWLADEDRDDGDSCQLRRVIRADGRSRAWINGRPATLAQLSELAPLMMEIHGQHEHQALLSRQHQLELLDAFANNHDTLEKVRTCARRWRELGARQRALAGGENHQQHVELLRHELAELQQWALPPEALAELENDHRRLANADRLLEGCRGISEIIDGDDEYALQHLLGRAQTELEHLAELDARLQPVLDLIAGAGIQLGEADTMLNHYAQDIDLDPDRYTEIDTRLSRLHDLSRRHRVPAAELKAKADALQGELDDLENASAT
ncbi:MAG TPA: AAA family ATPase, partial [Rhodanobacteraceae bacterium]|nr:AAA family ATPase [Rhodanobacteraceae bacterium]